MTAPAWMKHPVIPKRDPGIPPMTAGEEQAYCRLWGIPWVKRRKFTPFSNAPHPKSAYRDLPSLPAKIRNLSGQGRLFR